MFSLAHYAIYWLFIWVLSTFGGKNVFLSNMFCAFSATRGYVCAMYHVRERERAEEENAES